MHNLLTLLNNLRDFLWNFPIPILLLGTHLYFTFRLGFIQKHIPKGIRLSFSKQENNSSGISPYRALATALAATIGTGNIIGISTAIAIGGPGAVFWCWITGVFGIATCYCECFLSSKYKVKQKNGQFTGGPMYVLKNILHFKKLSIIFAIFAVLASFGIGSSVQANSIRNAITEQVNLSPHIIGIATAIIAGIIIIGGVSQISRICTFLVPIMSVLYLSGCIYLLFINYNYILPSISLIVKSAFSSQSFLGGIAGTAVIMGIRVGISRGLFTNEAGLGSIPMTAAASGAPSPVTQGVISMTGPFWDTVVICAITGIVIVSSILKNPSAYLSAANDKLCFIAFSSLPFYGTAILSICLVLFAFATIIGWSYFGECCTSFLFGENAIPTYQLIYILSIYFGAVLSLEVVWGLSDLFNACMIIPNLICIWKLKKIILKETKNEL